MKKHFYAPLAFLSIFFSACGAGSDNASRGPIVLGDPATIVSERDSQYLTDFVVDIQNNPTDDKVEAASEETHETPVAVPERPDTTNASSVAAQPVTLPSANSGNGLNIPFKEVTVFIAGITTRTYRTQNPQTANGVTYELSGGNLPGNKLQITGGGSLRVSQRYSTTIVARRGSEMLDLNSLGYTADWKPMQGSGNRYLIAGLEESKLEVKNISPAQIRNAVSRAARSKRLNRASVNEWENSVRNARSLKEAPFASRLRSVMWKIDGKDAKGKVYSKQIRIDIPVK